MDKKNIPSILQDALEEQIPPSEVHLWQAVKANLVVGRKSNQQGETMNTTNPRRRSSRLAFAAIAVVTLIVATLITPQGRAFAQSILQFFTRAESNTFELPPSQIPAIETVPTDSTALPPSPLTSILKAELQAGFDATELPMVPEGFKYLGARIYGNAISIEYEAQGGGGNLMIMQSKDGFIQSDWDRVPADAIIPVKIGELDGEFVEGTFVVYAGGTSATWNPEAAILRLRWKQDGIWIDMTKFGDVERIEYLDQAGMIKLAESLTTDPFPLDVKSAESQAGFDIWEPVKIPVGMTFLGAAFDPSLKMVSQSFGYYEADQRILIKQQPANTSEACDLCGIVGATASVENVQIGDVTGEYALGVWNLTDTGPVWQDDPYLKTIRWHKDGMAFELLYMGMEVEKEELVAIAASMK
jgi:hypothetical protein